MRRIIGLAAIVAASLCGCEHRREPVRVGSKNFTESIILGEILAGAIERHGIAVDRRLNLGGTFVCHKALVAGELDLYAEYTGTALTAILKLPPSSDPQSVYRTVQSEYERRFGLRWSQSFGFNDTFAIAIRGDDARSMGLATISDLARVQDRFRPGFGYEFLDRPDGWTGLQRAYGLSFTQPARTLDLGLLYQALGSKKVDVVAGNSTDGLIAALGLVVLRDDRRFFPPYEAAAVYRADLIGRYPAVARLFEKLHGAIDDDAMRQMNYEVDGRHRQPREVAGEVVNSLFEVHP